MKAKLAITVMLTALVASGAAHAQGAAPRGAALFEGKCAICHGSKGDGRGPAAYLLNPKPRDFTTGVYKFKSVPIGSIPTDEDLVRSVTHGLPGAAMPSWAALTPAELAAVVQYMKGFSPRFAKEIPGTSLIVPEEPQPDVAGVQRGEKLFQMVCATCHGAGGKGDGPASAMLRDAAGFPIRPRNFTDRGNLRGGGAAGDLYRTLRNGLEGAPMPSFAQLPESQIWDLIHFVQSLGASPTPFQASAGAEVIVQVVSYEIPLDPTDVRWREAPFVALPLRPLWSRDGAPGYALVRAMTDGKEIGVYVEWTDTTANKTVLRPQDFRDGVAIQFPVEIAPAEPGAMPFYGMGEKNHTVNIWHWKADWQEDLTNHADMGEQYAGMVTEFYPQDAQDRQTYSSGWAAGNLLSNRQRRSPVEDLNAQGLRTLTSQPADDQDVDGRGIWSGGIWRVTFKRKLSTGHQNDVQFTKESAKTMQMALAVWDGAANDRDGQKCVSEWHHVRVEGSPEKAVGGGCELGGQGASGLEMALAALLAAGLWALRRRRAEPARNL